ncbi:MULTISPECIES: fimbrial protein [Providencia]|uniref:Type 1 fimbrial protein n=1 Tax=Providencia stuartii TaxID=588 RepID=A0AAI9I0D7_PROST|nr:MULTISPECIES: fimbrial protein [Providencia]ELR5036302.1 type 1 fimbrial protein [Providencia stuartii]
MINQKNLPLLLGLFFIVPSPVIYAVAENTFDNTAGNWDVEGANGKIFVYGSLTESACHLSMDSAFQSVDLGNIDTASLKVIGAQGHKTPIYIELLDCIETPTVLRDDKSGNITWSTSQPGMKIRFIAPVVPFRPSIARVEGVTGLGLQITNLKGNEIVFGEYSEPQLISSGQNILTYYVAPVRVAEKLQAGAYRSVISFQITYE